MINLVNLRCNNLLPQAKFRMRSHGLRHIVTTNLLHVATGLLHVVNRLVASCLFQQTCCKLFQQVVTSLQMTNCNKILTALLQLDEIGKFVATC